MPTELEKQWELEEEACAQKEEPVLEDGSTNEGGLEIIKNPFSSPGDNEPMALVYTGTKLIMGGVISCDDKTCILSNPMEYIEQRVALSKPVGNEPPQFRVEVGFMFLSAALGDIPDIAIQFNFMYIMRGDRQGDLALVERWASYLRQIKAANAGISLPSNEEVLKVNREKA